MPVRSVFASRGACCVICSPRRSQDTSFWTRYLSGEQTGGRGLSESSTAPPFCLTSFSFGPNLMIFLGRSPTTPPPPICPVGFSCSGLFTTVVVSMLIRRDNTRQDEVRHRTRQDKREFAGFERGRERDCGEGEGEGGGKENKEATRRHVLFVLAVGFV